MKLLDAMYPKVCGFCDKIHPHAICNKCFLELKNLKEKEIYEYSNEDFSRHFAIFQYKGKIRQKLISYKFGDKPYLYEGFVNLLLKDEKVCEFLKSYDIIIPVPISNNRNKQRGYNQSELIAKGLTKQILGLKLETKVLLKKIDTIAQSSLSKNERIKNVIGSYAIKNKNKVIGKNILLFDDIFTTGSTVRECAKLLKEAGASQIAVLTIAKD